MNVMVPGDAVPTGIYVVCSDDFLLNKINGMLRVKGVIGISDAEGKFHYFIDGRKNLGRTVARIDQIVSDSTALIRAEIESGNAVAEIVKALLVYYDFDLTLIGTIAIQEIIYRMVIDKAVYFYSMRELNSIAQDILRLTYEQVERDIRYAVRKSSFDGMGIKTVIILRSLADEVFERIDKLQMQEKRKSI
ncbi:MAG: hypothetical protein MJ094_02030 [Saccharofermentans sp.]|nr:hypothetical protein [Saccharofermentans sp.]